MRTQGPGPSQGHSRLQHSRQEIWGLTQAADGVCDYLCVAGPKDMGSTVAGPWTGQRANRQVGWCSTRPAQRVHRSVGALLDASLARGSAVARV